MEANNLSKSFPLTLKKYQLKYENIKYMILKVDIIISIRELQSKQFSIFMY